MGNLSPQANADKAQSASLPPVPSYIFSLQPACRAGPWLRLLGIGVGPRELVDIYESSFVTFDYDRFEFIEIFKLPDDIFENISVIYFPVKMDKSISKFSHLA